MKDTAIKQWYNISVYVAGFLGLVLALGDWTFESKIILASTIFIFLQFFEEFAWPGGFAPMAMKVELKLDSSDPKEWPLNNLSAWYGNWWFALSVYFLALFLPDIHFLTLAVVLFSFAELLMHGLFFPIALKKIYNPGLLTTLIGLVPLSIAFFVGTDLSFSWLDYLLALGWIGLNYWLAFQSPIYKTLGKSSDRYAFSEEEVARGEKYLK